MKFIRIEGDPCLYVSRDQGEIVVIAVYVDDILIAAKTDKHIAEVKAVIANHFEVKDMGELHYFLGVKITQDLSDWDNQPTLRTCFDSLTCKIANHARLLSIPV